MGEKASSYLAEASALVGTEVLAAALFEPNVPDFIGGVVGLVTWPARRARLKGAGVVKTECLLVVTLESLYAFRARLRIRGFRVEGEIARWQRNQVEIVRVPVATWLRRPPPWPALRILEHGTVAAELKPYANSPANRPLFTELLEQR